MSTRSDNYEKKCVEELISLGYDASWTGGSDSTKPDILIKDPSGDYFVEVKMRSAQGAQFLVNLVENTFIFSSAGDEALAKPLVSIMNKNKDKFKKSGTHLVTENQNLCFEYISKYYADKGVKNFATKINKKWKFTPIEDLLSTYTVTAKYRKKKSGSRSLPKKDDQYFSSFPLVRKGKRVYINDKNFAKTYLGDEYYVNENLEIRKLSNRSDSCIIFEFKSKK